MHKHLLLLLLALTSVIITNSQSLSVIKKELENTSDPIGFVRQVIKKKYSIDTVAVLSSTSFLGLADSIAYKGKTGKVYGPFKGGKFLLKVLAKLPNRFYHVSHILLDTAVYTPRFADSLANTIIKRIGSGASSFEKMASTYSSDGISAAKGGDLGWFVRGVMLPQLDKAIGTHKKGEIFKVWTEAGLHVVTIKDNPKEDDGFALMLRVFL